MVAKLKVSEMTETEHAFLVYLGEAMVQWSQHGMSQCSYGTLFGNPADCTAFLATLRQLVGSGYWSELYGARLVTAQDVIPQQLHAVVSHSLQKISAALLEASDTKTIAAHKSKAVGVLKIALKPKAKTSKT